MLLQVRRLEKQVRDSEQGLNSSTSQMGALQAAHDRMKAELEQKKTEVVNIKNRNSQLQVGTLLECKQHKLMTSCVLFMTFASSTARTGQTEATVRREDA